MVSESKALLKETLMPVYVAPEDEQLLYMYDEVKQAAATRTSSIFVRGERSKRILHFTVRKLKNNTTLRFVCFHFGSPSKHSHSYSLSDLSEQQCPY